jgi:hypothetical protein
MRGELTMGLLQIFCIGASAVSLAIGLWTRHGILTTCGIAGMIFSTFLWKLVGLGG